MKEEIKILLRRADIFLQDAEFDLKNRNFDICMFHLEQSAQLIIKAKLLELKGEFKKTHSLRELLTELGEIWMEKEIQEFIKKHQKVLRNLERAYITSRYFFEEFFEDEVVEAFDVVRKIKKMLWET